MTGEALSLVRSWLAYDGSLINPATCGQGGHAACDGTPCECDCDQGGARMNGMKGVIVRNTATYWQAIDRRVTGEGHGEHGGYSVVGGVVFCFCGRDTDGLFRIEQPAGERAA